MAKSRIDRISCIGKRGMATKTLMMNSTLSAVILIVSCLTAQPHPAETWTKQRAKTWFEGRKWLKGLTLQPHKSVNQVEFARQYHLHPAWWDSAFAFLRRRDLESLPNGKYPIDGGDVFASVTEDSTKNFRNTRWESHRKYADIQYVISGEERIGVCPVAKATVTQAYSQKQDVAHYAAKGKQYLARPGTFFIFLPTEAHRPNIAPGGNRVDKKIVIKVRVTGYERK